VRNFNQTNVQVNVAGGVSAERAAELERRVEELSRLVEQQPRGSVYVPASEFPLPARPRVLPTPRGLDADPQADAPPVPIYSIDYTEGQSLPVGRQRHFLIPPADDSNLENLVPLALETTRTVTNPRQRSMGQASQGFRQYGVTHVRPHYVWQQAGGGQFYLYPTNAVAVHLGRQQSRERGEPCPDNQQAERTGRDALQVFDGQRTVIEMDRGRNFTMRSAQSRETHDVAPSR
jgi:hypothetical protein